MSHDKYYETKKLWKLKNPDYDRNWQRTHKDRVNQKNRLYRLRNPEKERERHKTYRLKFRDKVSEYYRDRASNKRLQLCDVLGSRVCIRCGFADIRALQFDHINGKGCSTNLSMWNRKTLSERAINYYINNIQQARDTLQVLCANCNQIKKVENKECVIHLRPYREKVNDQQIA